MTAANRSIDMRPATATNIVKPLLFGLLVFHEAFSTASSVFKAASSPRNHLPSPSLSSSFTQGDLISSIFSHSTIKENAHVVMSFVQKNKLQVQDEPSMHTPPHLNRDHLSVTLNPRNRKSRHASRTLLNPQRHSHVPCLCSPLALHSTESYYKSSI